MATRIIKMSSRDRRHARVRSRVVGTAERPRLAVFRSLKHIYAQIIDDSQGVTLATASDRELPDMKLAKLERATKVGTLLAQRAIAKQIGPVVFDRGGYRYHGRVKALALGARAGKLEF